MIKIWIRRPGVRPDSWDEQVTWPDSLPVPAIGDWLELPGHGQVMVHSRMIDPAAPEFPVMLFVQDH